MERRFACTACGRCCVGRLPLTLADALAHAGRFPLGLVLAPIRQGHKSHAVTARLGTEIRLPDRRRVAVRIMPSAWIPPAMACPALGPDGLCAIHDAKPSRCRAMPFLAWRDEADQAELLIPRPGWSCDVSATAPVVYRDKKILDRAGFDAERADLESQAKTLRKAVDTLAATTPGLVEALARGREVLLGFTVLLPWLDGADKAALAAAQLEVLGDIVARADGEFQAKYREWIADWERVLRRLG
ncbi:MAG: YkgJ family cysteine cluster protein [Pseudomonadota bacterium]